MAIIYGDGGNNVLNGTPSADEIFGYGGNDTLLGRSGADTLHGGSGDDVLDGGGGRDVMDGGSGDDTVTYANFARVWVNLATGVVNFYGEPLPSEQLISIEGAIGGAGNDTLIGSNSRNVLHGGAGSDLLDGGIGADALFGDNGRDGLYGGYGSDTLDGGAGSDGLYGDSQDTDEFGGYFDGVPNAVVIALQKPDTVSYALETAALTLVLHPFSPGTATLAGSNDVDSLYGFQNAVGGDGADSITGNSEDNLLVGSRGNDTLRGGDGDDTLVGNAGTDRMMGGAGSDWVDYSENTNALRLNLATQFVSFPGTPWSSESFSSIENATTGSGNDTLFGNGAANILDGGLGADRISGGAGSDTVSYRSHAGAVSVDLAGGIGTVVATGVRDTFNSIENATGGVGNDVLRAAAAGSVLDGGAGNDTLTGASGSDTFHLTAGSDVIQGGAGSDTVVLDFGYDAYPDLSYTLYYDDYLGIPNITNYDGDNDLDLLVNLASGSVVSVDGPSVHGTLAGIENVTTGVGNDSVTGSDGANVISVGHGANVVDAGGGNDLIYGSNTQSEWVQFSFNEHAAVFFDERDTREVLRGGAGSDTIVGGMSMAGQGGDDRLVAALVAETTHMSGGAGADSFVFSDNARVVGYHAYYVEAEHATISDFSHDEGDRIVIEHADAGTPDPTFVGTVTNKADIDVGEWGFYDGKVFIPRDYDIFEDTETPGGLEIEIVGGNITEDDVLFV